MYKKRLKRHQTMINMYGTQSDHICGECKHLIEVKSYEGYAGKYFKCDLTRMTHGAATDWRKRWDACGKFEIRE